jgi:transcriptional regulator with XRE-family HTH domain
MARKPTKPNLGQLLDGIWSRLPEDNYLRELEPLKIPGQPENLRFFGKAIIKACEDILNAPIDVAVKDYDRETWERLVGAWALHQRSNRITRCAAAKRIGVDRSNLTIALNGKRPLTQSVLVSLANLLKVQPFDIRPDLGASYAHTKDRDVAKKLNTASSHVLSLKGDVSRLIEEGYPLEGLLGRIDTIRGELSH